MAASDRELTQGYKSANKMGGCREGNCHIRVKKCEVTLMGRQQTGRQEVSGPAGSSQESHWPTGGLSQESQPSVPTSRGWQPTRCLPDFI